VKTRYKQPETKATIYPGENDNIRVVFENPQRAITPGQAVVFYDNDVVVGGGTISLE
jgi:tRNA-specific 2-thiouridylase